MKIIFTLLTIIIPAFLFSQFVTDFEDIVVADNTYIKESCNKSKTKIDNK